MAQKANYKQIPGGAYSTNEVDTGLKWVDGRPIYRKVLTGMVNMIIGEAIINHGITELTDDYFFISLVGGIKLGGTGNRDEEFLSYREGTSVSAGNWYSLRRANKTYVSVQGTWAWGNSEYNLILEYVK